VCVCVCVCVINSESVLLKRGEKRVSYGRIFEYTYSFNTIVN